MRIVIVSVGIARHIHLHPNLLMFIALLKIDELARRWISVAHIVGVEKVRRAFLAARRGIRPTALRQRLALRLVPFVDRNSTRITEVIHQLTDIIECRIKHLIVWLRLVPHQSRLQHGFTKKLVQVGLIVEETGSWLVSDTARRVYEHIELIASQLEEALHVRIPIEASQITRTSVHI
jgi:hypothetical protein